MSASTGATALRDRDNTHSAAPTAHHERRLSTETKSSFKTTELIVYVVAVAAVLIAAMVVDESNAGGFGAQQAWLYTTLLSVGYMISRGLAKSGSRDPYTSSDEGR